MCIASLFSTLRQGSQRLNFEPAVIGKETLARLDVVCYKSYNQVLLKFSVLWIAIVSLVFPQNDGHLRDKVQ